MSYDDMMNITEHDLEQRNITKGARQKLFLSIQKLRARSAVLLESERQLFIDNGDNHHWESKSSLKIISQILFQIRAFLSTPICCVGSGSGDERQQSTNDDNDGQPDESISLLTVDVNNNNNNRQTLSSSTITQNGDLPSIIVRLIGHGK